MKVEIKTDQTEEAVLVEIHCRDITNEISKLERYIKRFRTFNLMGIFQRGGSSAALWIIFFSVIGVLYITSLVIDKIVMKKKGEDYTQKLREYNRAE